jgi:hypothetical protein
MKKISRKKKRQPKPDFKAAFAVMLMQMQADQGARCWQPTDPYEQARKDHMEAEAEVELQRMLYVTLGGEEWAEKMIADSREWAKQRHAEIGAELAAATGGAS